jgi:hypothetical protein
LTPEKFSSKSAAKGVIRLGPNYSTRKKKKKKRFEEEAEEVRFFQSRE